MIASPTSSFVSAFRPRAGKRCCSSRLVWSSSSPFEDAVYETHQVLLKLQTLLAATASSMEEVAHIAELHSLPSADLAPQLDDTLETIDADFAGVRCNHDDLTNSEFIAHRPA